MSFIIQSLIGFSNQQNATAPNAAIPVSYFFASGAAANVDVGVIPKGAGAILAAIPDNTIVGGNKRGSRAVDLQTLRTAATQVASGATSAILSGASNTASQSQSLVVGGNSNQSNAQYDVVVGGLQNVAQGIGYSFIGGGSVNSIAGAGNNSVIAGGGTNAINDGSYNAIIGGQLGVLSGSYSVIVGGASGNDRGCAGAVVMSSQAINAVGGAADSQKVVYTMRRVTTDATPSTVSTASDANAAAGSTPVLPNNSAFAFKAQVVARDTGTGDAKYITLEGLIKRGANAAATALVGAVTTTVVAADAAAAAWTAVASASLGLGGLVITVTGEVGKTLHWCAVTETAEVV